MPDTPEKLDLRSMDVADNKRRQLRQLFPEVFTESSDAGGNPAELDFERLKAVLGEHVSLADPGAEKYGLEWPGKRDALKAVQTPALGTLVPCPEESVDWETTKNVFIEGDNLEVLKLLQKSYYGKVKMIYIDPPYNTGNDFVYPDNYAESLDTYLRYTGQISGEGVKLTTNAKDSGRFHSNWLRMMYPRLYVAKNLLREDGVIFISIDDNEVGNLRALCDHVFGEENFLGNITRATGQTTGQDSGGLGNSFDFLLAYSKTTEIDLSGLPLTPRDLQRFDSEDEKGQFAIDQMRKTGSNDRRSDRPNMWYPVIDPDGNEVYPVAPAGYEGRWRFSRDTYDRAVEQNLILWKKTKRDGGDVWWPYVKYYAAGRTKRPSPLWNDLDGNKKAARDLRSLFGGKKVFDFPKPVGLIERCIQIAPDSSMDDLVMDFFAGSGTTGHAVMSLNASDGGNRRYVCVQLPESCSDQSEANDAGLASISELSKQRLRKAGERLRSTSRTSAPNLDIGFRCFELRPSNFKRWDGEAAAESEAAVQEQLEAHLDHLAEHASEESMLFEILLKAGFELTCPVEKLELAGHPVYSVEEGSLLLCLADRIGPELIDAVAERHPLQFLCLDKALHGDDALKVNALETFRALQPEIQFRTV